MVLSGGEREIGPCTGSIEAVGGTGPARRNRARHPNLTTPVEVRLPSPGQEHYSVIEDDGPVWPGDL